MTKCHVNIRQEFKFCLAEPEGLELKQSHKSKRELVWHLPARVQRTFTEKILQSQKVVKVYQHNRYNRLGIAGDKCTCCNNLNN